MHVLRIAYLRRSRLDMEHKESMNDILIHTSRLYHKPTNPDKSRPCLTHERLQLILSDWSLLNVVDSEVFRITANACYIIPRKSHRRPLLDIVAMFEGKDKQIPNKKQIRNGFFILFATFYIFLLMAS